MPIPVTLSSSFSGNHSSVLDLPRNSSDMLGISSQNLENIYCLQITLFTGTTSGSGHKANHWPQLVAVRTSEKHSDLGQNLQPYSDMLDEDFNVILLGHATVVSIYGTFPQYCVHTLSSEGIAGNNWMRYMNYI